MNTLPLKRDGRQNYKNRVWGVGGGGGGCGEGDIRAGVIHGLLQYVCYFPKMGAGSSAARGKTEAMPIVREKPQSDHNSSALPGNRARSTMEAEKRNQEIEKKIRTDKIREKTSVKLLLLGE